MRRPKVKDYEIWIPYVRGFIGYLWIVVSFGCIALLVQASMEEKDIRLTMGEKNFEKRRLLEEIRHINNKIAELERYERIEEMVAIHLPQLGPPAHPAIEIPVPGLRERSGYPETNLSAITEETMVGRMRNRWQSLSTFFRGWAKTLLE